MALNPIGYIALFALVRRTLVLALPRLPMVFLLENRWFDAGLLASFLTGSDKT